MALKIELLRENFASISFKNDRLSEYLYDNLFTRYPETRELFKTVRMDEQRKKIIHALAVVLRNFENPKFIAPYLQGLGLTHVAYGARPDLYEAIGECFLDAIAKVTGEVWTDELAEAWTEAFEFLAGQMLKGAAIIESSGEREAA